MARIGSVEYQQRPSHIHRETNMNTNRPVFYARSFICGAALAACAVLASPVQAKDQEVLVRIPIDTTGLDLSQPAAAREVYSLIQRAARTACTSGNRVDLAPPTSYVGCYERALGAAVGSAHQLQISIVYLESHTPRDAATYSIDVPVRVAAE
jgi:UrcA family protein